MVNCCVKFWERCGVVDDRRLDKLSLHFCCFVSVSINPTKHLFFCFDCELGGFSLGQSKIPAWVEQMVPVHHQDILFVLDESRPKVFVTLDDQESATLL